ncbi:MAG TPA: B12-binding domain-containing radical SAM protein, partial [bacterium]|nr:B12-binding domain-containing radical SAM protein [bacterium]
PEDFERASSALQSAGYREGEIGVYLMLGLPGQPLEEIERSIRYVLDRGLKIFLAEYAIVPGTPEAEKFPPAFREEPLLHNNSIYPAFSLGDWPEIYRLKALARSSQ